MKLTEKYIEKYLADFHYELTREQLEQDWILDDKPYYKEKDCFCFHAADKCWLEVGRTEIAEAFEDCEDCAFANMSKDYLEVFARDADFKPSTKLKEIGREDFKKSGFYAGVEYEKKVAIAAFKEIMEMLIDNRLDLSVDYLGLFEERL